MVPIDEHVERWIQAIKAPFITYAEPAVEIPELLTDIARRERFMQADDGNTDPIATNAELYLYLLTKYLSSDRTEEDDRLFAHLSGQLHDQYPAIVPDPGAKIREYGQLDQELARRLRITAGYIEVEKEQFYDAEIRDYAEACWDRFGCYIDPHFRIDHEYHDRGGQNGQ